jgi:hypothetical protein
MIRIRIGPFLRWNSTCWNIEGETIQLFELSQAEENLGTRLQSVKLGKEPVLCVGS